MHSAAREIFIAWRPPIFLTALLLATSALYLRGWVLIRRTRRSQFPVWRLALFLLGLTTIWIAIASPLDGFADALLSAHMVEHLLLMSFVPPFLLLGHPLVPLLRALPRAARQRIAVPLIRTEPLRRFSHWVTKPLMAWLAMNLMFVGWHIPTAYDFALQNEYWHDVEHLCFLGTSILFWWPLVRPWPTRASKLGWFVLPYLVMADIVNTVLSAFLAFCDRPVYRYYLTQPNPFDISPLSDQRAGAAVMWVIGSLVFLLPAMIATVKLLRQKGLGNRRLSRV